MARRQKRLTREQVLGSRPRRNPELFVERNDEKDEVSIRVPRRRTWWIRLLTRFGRLPDYHVVTLDGEGTQVWDLCDGEHSVGDMIEVFSRRHQLGRKEAELSMLDYLRKLGVRGLIVFEVEEANDSEEADEAGQEP